MRMQLTGISIPRTRFLSRQMHGTVQQQHNIGWFLLEGTQQGGERKKKEVEKVTRRRLESSEFHTHLYKHFCNIYTTANIEEL